jgi:hypothetical protein
MLTTSCHCGTVRIEVARKPRSVTECSCSICRRYGARWAYYSRKAVKIAAPPTALKAYKRGRVLYFDHCRRCGCVMAYRPIVSAGAKDRLGVNLRMVDDPDALAGLKILRFDGAKTWRDVGICKLDEPWW